MVKKGASSLPMRSGIPSKLIGPTNVTRLANPGKTIAPSGVSRLAQSGNGQAGHQAKSDKHHSGSDPVNKAPRILSE